MSMLTTIKQFFSLPSFSRKPGFKFIEKRSGPFTGTVKLSRDRVYVLPTRSGLIFSLLLFILLIGSINYNKSLGFAFTFFLAGFGNVILYSCWKNLAGLYLKSGGTPSIFSGDTAHFTVLVENTDNILRPSIQISQHGVEFAITDLAAQSINQMRFKVKGQQRGWLNAGKFRLYTEYPAGLFVAWTWLDLSMRCLVYPKPVSDEIRINRDTNIGDESNQQDKGNNEYDHLTKFNDGESWRHICWKTAAKNDELYSKQFKGGAIQDRWINWFDIKINNWEINKRETNDVELRLSIMARLIINANEQQQSYGLILPDSRIEPTSGDSHFHQCMKRLALFDREDKN